MVAQITAVQNRNYRLIGHFNYIVAFPAPRMLSFQRFESEFQVLSEKSLIVQVASAVLLPVITTRARKDGYSLSEQRFETVAQRKKNESRPTVIKISCSRYLFEAFKMLHFDKYM